MPIETINLYEKKYEKYLKFFTKQNWTLCVGAGICKGILPDWFDLTHNLVNACFGKKWDRDEFKKKYDEVGFGLDSWIQGCLNNLVSKGKSINDFNLLLEEQLYGELLKQAEKNNLKYDLIKMFESPKQLKRKKLFGLCDFFEDNYSATTLMQLVNVLLCTDHGFKLPSNIITFNADSLLYSLLTIFGIKNETKKKGNFQIPTESYKKITRTFQHWGNDIPIFHLHGSISPSSKDKVQDTRDLLIFLESSYNQIASNMYSWAQTTFLYLAQNTKMIFLGLSMCDPNIRRWLSWTYENYMGELCKTVSKANISLTHLWIKTKVSDLETQEFLDVSLRHMGVKIGLIKSWKDVKKTLLRIM
jgi:hypothetical protein